MEESKELTVPERAAVALGAAEHEKALVALAKKYSDIVVIANPAAREQVHAAYMTLKNARIAIEKAGKDARDDATKFSRAVISEVDRLTAITAAEEARLQALRDTYDAEREAERQAKLEAEQRRIASIRSRIADMATIPAILVGKSSKTIAAAIESLEAVEITLDTHQEFAGEGEMAKIATLGRLREMHAAQLAAEEAAAEAARQAEADRIERERVSEQNRIEAKRLADLAAEIERQAQAAREAQAQREAAEREQRRIAEEEQRLIQERAAAAMREQQEAHERRMAAERAEIQRQQDELNRAREAAEAAARAKQEAEEAAERAEAQRIADEQAAEARRIQAEKDAAEFERLRREYVEFEKNGPGDIAICETLAAAYDVSPVAVVDWLEKFDAASFKTPFSGEKAA